MRKALQITISVVILATAVGGFLVFGKKPDVPQEEKSPSSTAAVVETKPVTEWDRAFQLEVDGEAVTYRVVTVSAEVPGRIISKAEQTRGGTHVEKGSVLFQLDPINYELEINRLKAQLAQAEAELGSVQVDLKNTDALIRIAQDDWDLQKKHLNRIRAAFDRGATNQSDLEATMREELTARTALQTQTNLQSSITQQLVSRRASRDLVQAELLRAEVDLKRCTVVAPIAGTVVDDVVEEGDYVQSGDALVHISDSSRIEVKCSLQSHEMRWVLLQAAVGADGEIVSSEKSGDAAMRIPPVPCEVVYEIEGIETVWDGYISRPEGTGMDRDTRTFPCRVLVENPRVKRVNNSIGGRPGFSPPSLLSGMYVNVRFPISSPVPLLQLPVEAVRPGGQVWVMRDGRLRILHITVAHTEGDFALIRADDSGLQTGDRVVVSPLAFVRDGLDLREAERAQ